MSTTEEKKTDAEAGAEKDGQAAAAAAATNPEEKSAVDKSEDDLEIEVEAPEESEPEAEPDPMAELKARVEELEKGKKTNYDRFLRATADLENYRKRSRRDVKDARLDERGKILRDMLPVIDNLDRAVAHAEQTPSDETKSIIEGVNLVLRQFKQALERHNVTPLVSVGQPFDPAKHEAVSQGMTNEHPPGTVISELQTGYMMDERLLRPALVVVAVAMPEEAPAEAEEESADEAKAEAAEESADESAEESADEAAEESAEEASSESEASSAEDNEESSSDDSAEEDKAADSAEQEEPSEDKE